MLLHASPIPIEWSNAILRSGHFYLSSQSNLAVGITFLIAKSHSSSQYDYQFSFLNFLVTNSWFSLFCHRRSDSSVERERVTLLTAIRCLCCLSAFSLALGKILVYLIIFFYFQMGVYYQSFSLIRFQQLIPSMFTNLPFHLVTFCDRYSKGKGFIPLPRVGYCTLSLK